MVRLLIVSLLVAVAAAADNQPQTSDAEVQNLYKTLQLNQEQINAVEKGENASNDFYAYQKSLEVNVENLSCKGISVNPKDITFTFYSLPSQRISWTGDENKNLLPEFDPELETHVLINGRLQSEAIWKPAELAFTHGVRGNKMNVISVNWNKYSSCGYLLSVFFTVPGVAKVVSNMVQNTLVAENLMDYDKLRFSGFGLGAHIAGLAARKLPQKPARISALDPAGGLYDTIPNAWKIKNGDAKFIDVIMTNLGNLGLTKLVGDINFLPAGGRLQPACKYSSNILIQNACSHHLAIEYYLESANKGTAGFVAKPAQSMVDFLTQKTFFAPSEVMGEGVSQKRNGSYYLEVNSQAPYSRGVNGAYLFSKANDEESKQDDQANTRRVVY